jgi:hypothetical protein
MLPLHHTGKNINMLYNGGHGGTRTHTPKPPVINGVRSGTRTHTVLILSQLSPAFGLFARLFLIDSDILFLCSRDSGFPLLTNPPLALSPHAGFLNHFFLLFFPIYQLYIINRQMSID